MLLTDYGAPAEVYANRRGMKKSLFYRKFDSLAEALRFLIEDPPIGLINTLVESGEERFETASIRTMYEADEYPLPRAGKDGLSPLDPPAEASD